MAEQMEKLCSKGAVEVLESLSRVVGNGIELAKRLKALRDELPDVKTIVETCSFSEVKKVKFERKYKDVECCRKRALEAALICVRRVADMMSYAGSEEGMERIKEGIERGNHTPLRDFIDQLHTTYLAKAEESCQEAGEKLDHVRSGALNLATIFKKETVKTVTKKRMAVGAAGAAALACVFIFTSGTVCLVLGTLTVGVTALGIYYVPSYWNDGSRLGQLFERVESSASRMLDYTCTISMYLKSISDMIDNIKVMMETNEPHSSLTAAFDRLCKKCGGLNTSLHQDRLKKITDEEFLAEIEGQLDGHI